MPGSWRSSDSREVSIVTVTRTRPAFDGPPRSTLSRPPNVNVTIVVLFLVAHVALGLLASELRLVATAHGVLTVLVGLAIAFTSPRIDRILGVAGYAAMCDVFWRMTKAQIPWEGAKYLAAGLLLIGFVRFVKRPLRTATPIAYLAFLLPAAAITAAHLPLGQAREAVSANLAGPVLVAVSAVVFRQVLAEEHEVVRLLWILLGPIVAVCAVATRSTAQIGSDAFSDESNFAAAGGFGPNQVSMLLALGALICLVWALQGLRAQSLMLQMVLCVWFTAQAALTFSRGGLYGAAGGVAAILIVALTTSGMRSRVMMGLTVALVIGVVAFPYVNAFTAGSLEERFADTSTTNRGDIATADFELFQREPLFGVGIGMGSYERLSTEAFSGVRTKAHTEFTRMLGEHGVLGLVSLALLAYMAFETIRSTTGRWNRLYAAAFIVWSLLSMSHSATSIAAICFMFGFAQLRAAPSAGRVVARG